jgi:Transposase DDE domain
LGLKKEEDCSGKHCLNRGSDQLTQHSFLVNLFQDETGALSGSEGFVYDEKNDWYICQNNKILKGSGKAVDDGRGHLVKKYFSLQSDCKNCPLRKTCVSDKAKTKKVQHSIYKAELERAKARQQTVKAKVMKRKRSSTVEPVWGTLINFTGMKRLNGRGIQAANKMLLLAATVYNLKKWLRYSAPKTSIKAMAMVQANYGGGLCLFKTFLLQLILSPVAASKFPVY